MKVALVQVSVDVRSDVHNLHNDGGPRKKGKYIQSVNALQIKTKLIQLCGILQQAKQL